MIKYVKNENHTVTLTMSEDMFEENYCFCADCGKVVFINDATRLDGEYYCDDCLTTCDVCGCVIRTADAYHTDDSSGDICHDCYLNDCWQCDDCRSRFRYEDSLFEVDGRWYCSDCYENHRPIINSYHTMKNSGNITFYGDEKQEGVLFIGVELEVDSKQSFDRDEVALELQSYFGDFIEYENDGSLYHGIELISHPATLDYHLDMMPTYREAFQFLLKNGITSHDVGTCGLHHHISRKYFGDKEDSSIAKILYLSEKFRGELMKFSRRTEDQAADWCRSRKQNYRTEAGWIKKAVKESKQNPEYQSRYLAINLTNKHTIELRLFRGTLNADTFEATLRFTARLAKLCRDTRAIDLAKMSFLDILGDDPVILKYWNRVKY